MSNINDLVTIWINISIAGKPANPDDELAVEICGNEISFGLNGDDPDHAFEELTELATAASEQRLYGWLAERSANLCAESGGIIPLTLNDFSTEDLDDPSQLQPEGEKRRPASGEVSFKIGESHIEGGTIRLSDGSKHSYLATCFADGRPPIIRVSGAAHPSSESHTYDAPCRAHQKNLVADCSEQQTGPQDRGRQPDKLRAVFRRVMDGARKALVRSR